MDGQVVWVPHAIEGFILGKIVDLGASGVTVAPLDSSYKSVVTTYDLVYPSEEDRKKDVDDNCK